MIKVIKLKIKSIILIILMFFVLLVAINIVTAKNIEITNETGSKEINNFFNKELP